MSSFQLDEYIVGKCMTMCPEREIHMREKERLLHILEMVPGTENQKLPKADPDRMVKSFNRSAAGKLMTDEDCLRPPEVLLKTINYLFDDVIQKPNVSWIVKYDFINDRLRSIRQDMVIQNLSRAYFISLLQPMVRFYAYSAYKFCDKDVSLFDPYLNKKHLHECLNRLLIVYDDIEFQLQSADRGSDHLSYLKKSRPQFEALYIILNLDNEIALNRMLNLSKIWRTHLVQTAILIALNYLQNNSVRVCRYLNTLPPLLLALSSLHLPEIRRKTLQIMTTAYSCKNRSYPLKTLKNLLLYGCEEDVIADCMYFGIKSNETSVQFDKNSFNERMKQVSFRKENFVEEKLMDTDETILLLYGDI